VLILQNCVECCSKLVIGLHPLHETRTLEHKLISLNAEFVPNERIAHHYKRSTDLLARSLSGDMHLRRISDFLFKLFNLAHMLKLLVVLVHLPFCFWLSVVDN
jgi:hypothetical protein